MCLDLGGRISKASFVMFADFSIRCQQSRAFLST
jgi:hypothetical protein